MKNFRSIFRCLGIRLALAFSLAFFAFTLSVQAQEETTGEGNPSKSSEAGQLDLSTTLLSFDATRGEADARTTIVPKGALANSEGQSTQNLRLTDTESVTSNELEIKQGRPIPGFTTRYETLEGDASAYPFDRYKIAIGMYVTPVNSDGTAGAEIPVDYDLVANLAGFDVVDKVTSEDSEYIEREIFIERSTPVKIFSITVMVIMWILALIVVSMSISILSSGKMPETGALGFMAALLFAFPAMRNAQPNVPPVGTFSDFAAFFWAELLVVLALLIVGFCWLTRYRR